MGVEDDELGSEGVGRGEVKRWRGEGGGGGGESGVGWSGDGYSKLI